MIFHTTPGPFPCATNRTFYPHSSPSMRSCAHSFRSLSCASKPTMAKSLITRRHARSSPRTALLFASPVLTRHSRTDAPNAYSVLSTTVSAHYCFRHPSHPASGQTLSRRLRTCSIGARADLVPTRLHSSSSSVCHQITIISGFLGVFVTPISHPRPRTSWHRDLCAASFLAIPLTTKATSATIP